MSYYYLGAHNGMHIMLAMHDEKVGKLPALLKDMALSIAINIHVQTGRHEQDPVMVIYIYQQVASVYVVRFEMNRPDIYPFKVQDITRIIGERLADIDEQKMYYLVYGEQDNVIEQNPASAIKQMKTAAFGLTSIVLSSIEMELDIAELPDS